MSTPTTSQRRAVQTPITSLESLYSLSAVLGEHSLVDMVATRFGTWEELAGSSVTDRAWKLGPWAAQLKVAGRPDPLPDFGAGVDALGRYDRAYPSQMTDLQDAPVILYHRGSLPAGPYVAVGGTLHPTDEALEISRAAARALVRARKPLVAALDSGCGAAAIEEALSHGGVVVAVAACDLSAPSQNTETVGRILERRGCIVSQWGPGEAWSESRVFGATRLASALAKVVFLSELGAHPVGGAHMARAAVAANRFIVVPEPSAEQLLTASNAGTAVFGRARGFSPKMFGANPRMLNRVARGEPAADAVVNSEEGLDLVLGEALKS